MRIHTEGSGHRAPAAVLMQGHWIYFEPFTRADDLAQVHEAIAIAKSFASGPTCEQHFKSMPGKGSLMQLLESPYIWLSIHSGDSGVFGAVTHVHRPEITITRRGLDLARTQKHMLAALLCHELAHVNGVPDPFPAHFVAYQAPMQCGLPNTVEGSSWGLLVGELLSAFPSQMKQMCGRCR